MPHVKITELLAEVDQWTNLGGRFLHLRTQAPPKNRQALLTAVLADGINLGLTRMSEACHETTWRQHRRSSVQINSGRSAPGHVQPQQPLSVL